MVAFLGLHELGARVGTGLRPWMLVPQLVIPGGLVLYYGLRGSYPELRGYRGGAGGFALDVLVGLAGAALWMAPYLVFDSLRPDPADGFDPEGLGAGLVWLALTLRVVGYGLATPFIEELFLRSWLVRYADVFDRPVDFRDVPIASFAWRSFLIVVIYFTFSHMPWEWPVSFAWGLGSQLWFYHRRHLAALVVVHATSNLAIFGFVLAMNERFTDASGQPLSLWFFL
jgi:CAAX prenyl protease-like protein